MNIKTKSMKAHTFIIICLTIVGLQLCPVTSVAQKHLDQVLQKLESLEMGSNKLVVKLSPDENNTFTSVKITIKDQPALEKEIIQAFKNDQSDADVVTTNTDGKYGPVVFKLLGFRKGDRKTYSYEKNEKSQMEFIYTTMGGDIVEVKTLLLREELKKAKESGAKPDSIQKLEIALASAEEQTEQLQKDREKWARLNQERKEKREREIREKYAELFGTPSFIIPPGTQIIINGEKLTAEEARAKGHDVQEAVGN